jgi:hypothetical protein
MYMLVIKPWDSLAISCQSFALVPRSVVPNDATLVDMSNKADIPAIAMSRAFSHSRTARWSRDALVKSLTNSLARPLWYSRTSVVDTRTAS